MRQGIAEERHFTQGDVDADPGTGGPTQHNGQGGVLHKQGLKRFEQPIHSAFSTTSQCASAVGTSAP